MDNEAYDRNHSLEIIHSTKLPSYALWGNSDISKESNQIRLNWWEEVEKEYDSNECSDKSIYQKILYWIGYYEKYI